MSETDTNSTGRARQLIDKALETQEGRAHADRVRLALRLGALVHQVRIRAGLTQAELARRIGTRQSLISRLEGGNLGHVPGNELLDSIAVACGYRMTISMEPDIAHQQLEPVEVVLHADEAGSGES
ncbi:helix-turn-helix transcriptional regulator [Halomonas sp. BM-2019]|uniref:helix-turn-helix domain-containing protein n=1 Tax=Halomonas sp. BM-2019 TaxID=2811227 RepID=UPI001B3C3AB1|nr:MAG: helix-turn-helix domain-containing protein [Halomonas sp. BM-2019]